MVNVLTAIHTKYLNLKRKVNNMDYKKEVKAIVGQVIPPLKVCYTWEEFKKRFKKMGKFMAVVDWR